MNRHERRRHEKKLRKIFNSTDTMIHEKHYKPMNCVLCNAKMKTVHHTHNPYPLTPCTTAKQAIERDTKDRCCSKCNIEKVTPARIEHATGLSLDKIPASAVKVFNMNDPKDYAELMKMKNLQSLYPKELLR